MRHRSDKGRRGGREKGDIQVIRERQRHFTQSRQRTLGDPEMRAADSTGVNFITDQSSLSIHCGQREGETRGDRERNRQYGQRETREDG